MSGLFISIAIICFVCVISGKISEFAMRTPQLRSLEDIYQEVIDEIKEKLPDADCRCISIQGHGGADFYYIQKYNRYELEISDWGRLLSTQTFLSDEACKQDMIERVVSCYSIKKQLNEAEKQVLLDRFNDH